MLACYYWMWTFAALWIWRVINNKYFGLQRSGFFNSTGSNIPENISYCALSFLFLLASFFFLGFKLVLQARIYKIFFDQISEFVTFQQRHRFLFPGMIEVSLWSQLSSESVDNTPIYQRLWSLCRDMFSSKSLPEAVAILLLSPFLTLNKYFRLSRTDNFSFKINIGNTRKNVWNLLEVNNKNTRKRRELI